MEWREVVLQRRVKKVCQKMKRNYKTTYSWPISEMHDLLKVKVYRLCTLKRIIVHLL